jgi:hypothetical protein
MSWKDAIINHAKTNREYSLRDLQTHFTTKEQIDEFATMLRQHSHKPLREFVQTANDWNAFVPPALLSTIAQFGLVDDLPVGLITNAPESRESVTKRFVWKSEPIEDYLEGESFGETYIEGATNVIRWRKPAAKLVETRESALDLPLSVMQTNAELTMNEFKAREWKHFTHELHKASSNAFDIRATLKNGEIFDTHWAQLFSNVYDGTHVDDPYDNGMLAGWEDIKNARSKMLRRERDAVRPTIAILNATSEAQLADTVGVNNAAFLGGANTFFQTGSLPNIYGLTFVVVPDALFGYFTNDTARKNSTFTLTNDVFLVATTGPTIIRHTREPLSTETWQIFDGQKQAMNIWERYEYSVFRHTNIMRIKKFRNSYGMALE